MCWPVCFFVVTDASLTNLLFLSLSSSLKKSTAWLKLRLGKVALGVQWLNQSGNCQCLQSPEQGACWFCQNKTSVSLLPSLQNHNICCHWTCKRSECTHWCKSIASESKNVVCKPTSLLQLQARAETCLIFCSVCGGCACKFPTFEGHHSPVISSSS